MASRTPLILFAIALPRLILKRSLWLVSVLFLILSASTHSAGFIGPQKIDPSKSSTPTLDSSFGEEAWLVYGYNIDIDGSVVDMQIYSSNGVDAVEQKTRDHINSLQFKPATRDGNPVKASSPAES